MDWNQRFFNSSRISAKAQRRLVRVYQTLGLSLASASAGAYLHSSSLLPFLQGGYLSLFAAVISLVALFVIPAEPSYLPTRRAVLLSHAFSAGLSAGPFFDALLLSSSSPHLLFLGLVSTAILFVSLSLSATVTTRRSVLYALGLLTSIASSFAWLTVASFFFPIDPYISVQLMFAILLLSVYVVADTQLLIDRAEHSPYGLDPVSGSLVLFSDFAQLLVRILVFLAERDQQRNTGRGPFRRSSSSSGSRNKGKRIERDDY